MDLLNRESTVTKLQVPAERDNHDRKMCLIVVIIYQNAARILEINYTV